MSYKKLILTIASVAVIAAPMAAFADDAPATTNADSSAGASAPVTVTADSSAGGSAPSTVDAGSSAGTGSTATVSSGGGSFSSSSSSSGGYVLISAPVTSVAGASTTCPLISSYMKLGASNNSTDVARLQAFLENNQNLDVTVTGTFDAKTEAAVEAFQKKYLSDILGPWGATKASGVVYITTMKKINQIACSQPLSLSAADLGVINAYKAKAANAETAPSVGSADATVGPVMATSTDSFNGDVGSAGDQNMETAAAGNASIMNKFWGFVKNLF